MRLLRRWRTHWALLRAETDRVGAEVERWPYEALNRAAEEQEPIERTVGGRPAAFRVDCLGERPDGDLEVVVGASGGPPTPLGIKPSYHFFKRRDGSVHYG